MAPNLKNSKPGQLINPANWSSRSIGTTDSGADFYNKSNCSFHGPVFLSNNYFSSTGVMTTIASGIYPSTQFTVGPYNEITFQAHGTAGTVTITGSIDGTNFVTCNTVTSADGFTRIQSLYKFIKIAGSGLDATSSLYMQIW